MKTALGPFLHIIRHTGRGSIHRQSRFSSVLAERINLVWLAQVQHRAVRY
jgi:hypothetical protein